MVELQQQSLFVPRNYIGIDLNTRKKKKVQRKEHSSLEIAKLIELSDWAKRKEICKTRHALITVHAHTRTHKYQKYQ